MLKVGEKAPDFDLPDADMEMIGLRDFHGRKNLVLYFYPKDGTPGCTIQAIDFSELEEQFDKHDTVVFGISRDDCLSHASFRDKHGLTVQLLADSEGEVCRLYGVLQERIVDGRTKIAVDQRTFIIDKQGTLKHILKVAHARGHAQEVLKLVRETG
jgi:thioredoxin-dependent peroxiredoxin